MERKKPTLVRAVLLSDDDRDLVREISRQLSTIGLRTGTTPHDPCRRLDLRQSPEPITIVPYSQQQADRTELVVRDVRRQDPTIPIILVTSDSSQERIINAFRAGVTDYIRVPIETDDLRKSLTRLGSGQQSPVNAGGVPAASTLDGHVIGSSNGMKEVRRMLNRLAGTDSTVLIEGETGTGKDLIARSIHHFSTRNAGPYINVNCAAIPDSLLESELFGHERGAFTGAHARMRGKLALAEKGTVLLDEIGDMPLHAQAKILQCIETKQVYPLGAALPLKLDIRIIAATNRDLQRLVAQGRFRHDLFYRLNVARIRLPPLRERREDIPELVDYQIIRLNKTFSRSVTGLCDRSLELTLKYDWPGNVRELLNAIEAAYISGIENDEGKISLPQPTRLSMARDGRDDSERRHIVAALFETNWNKSEAAQKLKWSRMTLYRKIAKYGISHQDASVVATH
jgi:DNA-binding NtrC family response regulator